MTDKEKMSKCQPEQSELKALIKILEIYAETYSPVSQQFYQGLCFKAKQALEELQAKLTEKKNEIEALYARLKEKKFQYEKLEQRISQFIGK